MDVTIHSNFTSLMYSSGLPMRLKATFDLKSNIKQYQVNEDKIVTTKKQLENYRMAIEEEPGWLMFCVANGVIEKARMVAANIMYAYYQRNMRAQWLTSFDNMKHIKFGEKRLVVIDALFFDSNAFRRDKIYEVINHDCNIPNQSVIVVAQNTDPFAVATQLGLRPNLTILMK